MGKLRGFLRISLIDKPQKISSIFQTGDLATRSSTFKTCINQVIYAQDEQSQQRVNRL